MNKSSVILLSILCANVFAEEKLPEIKVTASKLQNKEEVTYTTQSVTVESPRNDEHIGKTLARLPGVVSRNTSGPGSLTTATSPYSLNAASTAVSIDSIPIPDPAGVGINFSLIPSALVESVELHSAFYPSVDPSAVNYPAPGGRVNIRTQKSKIGTFSSRKKLSVLAGTASTLDLSGSYRFGDENQDLALGASFYSSKGNFNFKNPVSGIQSVRENNDSVGGGALAAYRRKVGSTGKVELIQLHSRVDRTNPGILDFPGRDHERDTFNVVGVSYHDPHAIRSGQGVFGKLANTYSRVQNWIDSTTRTDAHTLGTIAQVGYSNQHRLGFSTVSLDDLDERLTNDNGRFTRNTVGVTASTAFPYAEYKLIPMLRFENNTQYKSVGDATLTLQRSFGADTDISLSYGYQHLYPPIMATSGYHAGTIQVLPNQNILVERDSVTSFTVRHDMIGSRGKGVSLFTHSFYNFVRDRAAYSPRGFTQAQYINVPTASVLGQTVDAQYFIIDQLTLRSSVTVSRAWDRTTGHEFPYKPRLVGSASASWYVFGNIGVTFEEEFIGKRYINLTDDQSLSPFAQTNARFDFACFGGNAFFKVSNILDAGGFTSLGFPYPGRAYFFGYRL